MRSIIAAGLLAALAAAPAQADVIYSIVQTSNTNGNPAAGVFYQPTVPVVTYMQVVVSDEAFANGFRFSTSTTRPGTNQVDGLIGVMVQIVSGSSTLANFGLSDFLTQDPINISDFLSLSLAATPGGYLSGRIYATTDTDGAQASLNGTRSVTGAFYSDRFGACYNGGCSYSALQTTSVPEPMSIALFGAGLAGLAVARRRRAI